MTIVIDQGDSALAGGVIAVDLEPTAHPGKACKTPTDGNIVHALVGGHGNGRQGIEYVVAARHFQFNVQVTAATRATNHKPCPQAVGFNVLGPVVGVRIIDAIGDNGAGDPWDDFLHEAVIHTHHRNAVKWQVVEEIHKCLFQAPNIAAIGVHMVGFNVGYD